MCSVCFPANWQEVLLKHVDAEELPVMYGGKLTDPDGDPRCRTRVSVLILTECCVLVPELG